MKNRSLVVCLIIFGLGPSACGADKEKKKNEPPQSASFTDADYKAHVAKLKKKLPDKTFKIVIQKPFVVVGNESQKVLKRRAKGTIKWATDMLKKDYFTKDPKHIIDVWLFKDKKTYEKYTKQLFGSKPGTPYGYYSSSDRALVMNISTGGGTLVHEMVHTFIENNFPGCPSWFNEGLASLYEQCGQRKGHIVGFTNWRLAGLQKAVKAGKVPSFKKLTSTTTHQFYHMDKGTNYSQARYLCYYLQEKGLLVKYYKQFTTNCKEDPTGYKTLIKILDKEGKDMKAFKKKWEAWILKLHYP